MPLSTLIRDVKRRAFLDALAATDTTQAEASRDIGVSKAAVTYWVQGQDAVPEDAFWWALQKVAVEREALWPALITMVRERLQGGARRPIVVADAEAEASDVLESDLHQKLARDLRDGRISPDEASARVADVEHQIRELQQLREALVRRAAESGQQSLPARPRAVRP